VWSTATPSDSTLSGAFVTTPDPSGPASSNGTGSDAAGRTYARSSSYRLRGIAPPLGIGPVDGRDISRRAPDCRAEWARLRSERLICGVDGRVEGRVGGIVDGCVEGLVDGCVDGTVDGRVAGLVRSDVSGRRLPTSAGMVEGRDPSGFHCPLSRTCHSSPSRRATAPLRSA